MSVPDAGRALSPDEFLAELRWGLAQVAFLLHSEERSEQRLGEVRERVRHLGEKVQCVPLQDREEKTHVVGALQRAGAALGAVRALQENSARHRIKDAEDQLSAALGAVIRGTAGERP